MSEEFARTKRLLGAAAMEKLAASTVAVFGVGGVGSYAAEALARSGVGALVLVDSDTVAMSNVNRQIHATHRTVGLPKVQVMAERIRDIHPGCRVEAKQVFYLPETAGEFDFTSYDYVVDAVDTVTAKLQLIVEAKRCGTPIISCMGAGNKLDPTRFQIADIADTSVDPLARVMRRELKKRGILHQKVLFSTEKPLTPIEDGEQGQAGRRSVPGSVAFVPSVAGLIIGGAVIKDLIGR